jgi:23S rRNA (cytosine1962-C5)-methyltransferase
MEVMKDNEKTSTRRTPVTIQVLESYPNEWYCLLDSGDGRKLEKVGPYILIRPEAEAIWPPALPEKEWSAAHAEFVVTQEKNGGHWEMYKKMPDQWMVSYRGLQIRLEIGNTKQIGIFPEQSVHWEWMENRIKHQGRKLKVLNLFGYTGVASLAAAKSGATVTHLDASKKSVGWGMDNQKLSHLENQPIRWIVDDAIKFVEREARRNSCYDGILLDPPKFGRGPKGEVWEFYKLIPNLLQACRAILTPEPDFVILTAYAVKASSITLKNAMDDLMKKYAGSSTAGELTLVEKSGDRRLPTSIFVRWQADQLGD